MAREKYKPLSFSTTIRNPDRMPHFLKCLAYFEGETLTNELIHNIVRCLIREKVYHPTYIRTKDELSEIWRSEQDYFNDDQLDEIIANSPQQHKEAGFDWGWPSRFNTWYQLPMEFGYVRYAINEKIEISKAGQLLIDTVDRNEIDEQKIQNVFLNSLMKYQTRNPYRKTKTDNAPLPLLLRVLQMMHEKDPQTSGLHRQELSFLICWINNDAATLYETIMAFRRKYKFAQYSDELIYNECLKIMGYTIGSAKKYIKMERVTGEAVDEYIRKMRSTGIISLRGNGRFIDINSLEVEKIGYVLEQYAEYPRFDDKKAYFDYISVIDETIVTLQRSKTIDESRIRKQALQRYADTYSAEKIFQELQKVCNKKESKDPVFMALSAPTRFEFLISIALVQNFEGLDVNPNYTIDDEGLPTCTAAGGRADIICMDRIYQGLVEVTLIRGGRQQVTDEMLPVSRHLSEAMKEREKTVAIFVAPSIHIDAARYIGYIKTTEELPIIPYSVNEFLDVLNNYETLDDMVEHEMK